MYDGGVRNVLGKVDHGQDSVGAADELEDAVGTIM
jgi:hypothetical protein